MKQVGGLINVKVLKFKEDEILKLVLYIDILLQREHLFGEDVSTFIGIDTYRFGVKFLVNIIDSRKKG